MKTLLICILSIGILFTATSCLKKQNLDDDNLGPAIEPMQLTKILGEGFGAYDYNDIKKDEFTSMIYSQRFQDSLTQNLEQQGITVQKSDNTFDSLNLDVIVQKEVYSGGQSSQSTRAWQLAFEKSSAKTAHAEKSITTLSDPDRPILLSFFFQTLAFGSCYDTGKAPETCHNLTSTDIKYRVPVAAATQHGCTDVTNCLIDAKKIEYDVIEKTVIGKDGKPRRTHYSLVMSPNVPFLSRILQLCTRGIYELSSSNQNILVDMCYTINSYSFGN
ncbi:MAG: hypothetical protein WA160_13895 [Pseudobdellovibrio sp.]